MSTLAINSCALIVALSSLLAHAQTPAIHYSTSGGGPLSPSVVATWEMTGPDAGSSNLDLLVLWRGKPGWFNERLDGIAAGGSEHVHRILSPRGNMELRFDPSRRTVAMNGQLIALRDANVLLLDDVDKPGGTRVAGTARGDTPPSRSGPNLDVLTAIMRSSPTLFDFLRCDSAFLDPSDSNAKQTLLNCSQFRRQ
ncbi:MAG TPA: hypothetical protein VGQ37_17045 [Vicinamibacterales bacterium]|jgi:hypothetical protein|nr:hypothetical protein [Vicinamibacterales bacterium]